MIRYCSLWMLPVTFLTALFLGLAPFAVLNAEEPPLEPIPLPVPQDSQVAPTPTPAQPPAAVSSQPLVIEPDFETAPQGQPRIPTAKPPAPFSKAPPLQIGPPAGSERRVVTPVPNVPQRTTTVFRKVVYVFDRRTGIVRPVSYVAVSSSPTVSVAPHAPLAPLVATIESGTSGGYLPAGVRRAALLNPAAPLVVEEHVVIGPVAPPPYVPGQPVRNAIRRRLFQ